MHKQVFCQLKIFYSKGYYVGAPFVTINNKKSKFFIRETMSNAYVNNENNNHYKVFMIIK